MLSLALICSSSYLLLLLLKAYLSLRYASSYPRGQLEADITIIQPILSGDPHLASTLEHNLRYASDRVRFLWLVDDDDEVAQDIAKRLCQANARVKLKLCPPVPAAVNPKAFKLAQALSAIDTDVFAVLDDDTLLSEESLPQCLFSLQEAMVVTGLPYYLKGDNVWSSLVSHFVNNNSILTYLPLLSVAEPLSINGMFYLSRCSDITAMGGFQAVWHQLSDDFAVARAVKAHQGKIIQSITPHAIRTTVNDGRSYRQLMKRWFIFAQFQIRQQSPALLLLLAVFLGLPALLLWFQLLIALLSPNAWLVFLLLLGLRHLILLALHHHFFAVPPDFSWLMSVASELLQPIHMVHALISKDLAWRSRRIRVNSDGSFGYLKDSQ